MTVSVVPVKNMLKWESRWNTSPFVLDLDSVRLYCPAVQPKNGAFIRAPAGSAAASGGRGGGVPSSDVGPGPLLACHGVISVSPNGYGSSDGSGFVQADSAPASLQNNL